MTQFQRAFAFGHYCREITGAVPAAGAEATVTVPTDRRWVIYGAAVTLVTSAVAANRRVGLPFIAPLSGGGIIRPMSLVNHTASLTWRYYFGNYGESLTAVVDSTVIITAPFPFPVSAGFIIRTGTALIDVGDQYGALTLWAEDITQDRI